MQNGMRRRRRQLSPEEKWEVFLEVTSGQLTQADAARKWGVDVSVVIRIRKIAKDAALARFGVEAIVGADGITVAVLGNFVTLTGSVRRVTIETQRSLLLRGRRASSAYGTSAAASPERLLLRPTARDRSSGSALGRAGGAR
jgi:transposase-like protein